MPTCNNKICSIIGRCGITACANNRSALYGFTISLSLIALVFSIVGCVGLSTSTSTIKNVPWSTLSGSAASGSHIKIYVGVQGLVSDVTINGTKTETFNKWSSVHCNGTYCKNCKDSATGCTSTAIIGTLTIVLSIKTQYTRGFGRDSNFNKCMGMVTGMISFISLLSALSSFGNSCSANLPSSYGGISVDKSLGVGFVLMLISCITKGIVTLVHMCVPTPRTLSYLTQSITAAP